MNQFKSAISLISIRCFIYILIFILGELNVKYFAQIKGGSDYQKYIYDKSKVLMNGTSQTSFYDSLKINLSPCIIPQITQNKRIHFINEYMGKIWIANDSSIIANSSNLTDWNILNKGIQPEGINHLEFLSDKVIFASGHNGRIYKTTDGGVNWNIVYENISETNFINKIKFFNAMNGIAHGDQPFNDSPMALLNTTDGGNTWQNFNSYLVGISNINGVELESPSYVYLYGYYWSNGISYRGIWKSPDGGKSWNFQTVGESSTDSVTNVVSIMFEDSIKGYVAKADSSLWKTNDGGNSWSKIFKASSFINSIVDIEGSNTIYCLGSKGIITRIAFESTILIQEKIDDISKLFIYGHFTKADEGYILDWGSSFDRFYCVSSEITDVDKSKAAIPAFLLHQNYPNPFNPSTVISYQISVYSHATLKVYDILGNEIATLVNEEKHPGYYQVKFDGSNLAAGVYIYKLTAGNYTSAKKLMIMK